MPTPLHSTPRNDSPPAPLPEGVTRCAEAGSSTTLENCYAIKLTLQELTSDRQFDLVFWRDRPRGGLKPIGRERFTDTRPGDWARWRGTIYEVVIVEIWR